MIIRKMNGRQQTLSGGLETDGTDVKGGDCVTLKELLGEIKTPSPQTSDRLNKLSKLKKVLCYQIII